MSGSLSASSIFSETLQGLGIQHAFGLPGTQNMALFEALRTGPVQLVVPTHEMAAAFMANGYHRVSQRCALVLSISGPGFAFTLPAMAEASLDSAALLQITTTPSTHPRFQHLSQAIDQASMARPLTKGVFEVNRAHELGPTLLEAHRCASGGDPGPVLVQVDPACLDEEGPSEAGPDAGSGSAPEHVEPQALSQLAVELDSAQRPLLFVGQGCIGAADELRRLVERLGALVLSTSSGRGVLPEGHPLSLGFEFAGTRAEAMNELIERSDLVLALGCRFSQNGSRGFRLRIPPEKLVHLDRSASNLGTNYPARRTLQGDAKQCLRKLLKALPAVEFEPRPWSDAERQSWRERGLRESWLDVPEPRILGAPPAEFFLSLREALPASSHLVTDSGLHQLLARRHYRVEGPAGLVMPTGFQSMGFGLPAAIGAKLASPERTVAAFIGDGGLLMTGMELITAAELGLDLCVLVLNDASYGLIRRSQESAYGAAPSSILPSPDYEHLARSLGANYLRLGDDPLRGLREALGLSGVSLVEIPADDSLPMRIARAKGILKRGLGPRILHRLRAFRSS